MFELPSETHLPVIVDPSHAGGKAWMVSALARAAVAAGADGLLVKMHLKLSARPGATPTRRYRPTNWLP